MVKKFPTPKRISAGHRAALIKANTIHGLSKHPLHNVWRKIYDRCYNPKARAFQYYGARGIRMSDEWAVFLNFYTDVVAGYRRGLQLDRIDTNGPYSKGNTQWATSLVNNRHKTNARVIPTPEGDIPLWRAVEVSGINKITLWSRWKAGWPASDMFNPPRHSRRTT